jgi:hypothetical protein
LSFLGREKYAHHKSYRAARNDTSKAALCYPEPLTDVFTTSHFLDNGVMTMQDDKQTQTNHQPEEASKPVYVPPQVTVYEEEELLKTVAVLGCSPFATP